MSESKDGGLWGRWIPHPGNLLTGDGGGGWFAAGFGLVLGVPCVVAGLGAAFGVMRAPSPDVAAATVFMAVIEVAFGAVVLRASENYLVRSPFVTRRRSPALTLLAARAATALALFAGFTAMLADVGRRPATFFLAWGSSMFSPGGVTSDGDRIVDAFNWSATSGHSGHIALGIAPALWLVLPALLASYLLSRPVARLASLPPRRAVVAWAGTTAALVAIATVAWALSLVGLRSLPGADALWRGILWTLAGSGLAATMALAAQKRLALWDHADRWRDATLTADLRLVFADGSGSRPSSPHFNGYVGPVVVLPTADSAGSVFRGDGAPSDGWVVVGTKAALLESVQCAHATARITVAAVALMATAPLAAWLVSSVL
ncbi:MAG: hypothetical protein JWM10_4682 [Myxococcaceae bacterium]|nr:hypothetical protein [Myxococcaceae bacterium]